MAINQTECFSFEQRSVIKSLVAEKCKPCEICKRMCDVYREEYFSPKNFTNWLNIGLPLQAWVKKIVAKVLTLQHRKISKVIKEGHDDRVLGHKKEASQLISLKKG